MTLKFLMEGLKLIADYFGETWRPESIKAVQDELLKEPEGALVNAHKRVFSEFNPKPFPPIKRIVDIVQEEGRKIRMRQAEESENAWRREKGEDAQGRVGGDPLKAAARRSKLANDAIQLIELILTGKMSQREKAEGVQHMALTYPGIGYEDLALAWRSGRELEEPV